MTFPTGVDFRKYSDEELTTMLAEAGEASKHTRKRGRVMGIVAAHRLKQMKKSFYTMIWQSGGERMALIELKLSRKIGLVTTARFRPPRSNTMPACG